jgi:ABC-2 type transport system permease protein
MSALTGTWALVRLALRRDRWILPAWFAGLVAAAVGSAASTVGLYPTVESRQALAAGIGANPAVIALYGPIDDLSTLGGLAVWKPSTLCAVLIAIMSIHIVTRHTRAEEETGRLELVGSAVVGRHAALTAALIVAAAANLVLAVLLAAGLTSQGLPAVGSTAFALSLAAVGCVFAAVGGVAAQLSETARTVNGISAAVLGLTFLLRAVGDSAGSGALSFLSWLSPIGWAHHVRPYGPLTWWPLLLAAGSVVVLVGVAYVLAARRDLAAGLLAARSGRARGGPLLRSAFVLAWRLQRNGLLGWAAGFVVLGAAMGSVASDVGRLVEDTPLMRDMLAAIGGSSLLVDSYITLALGIAALIAAAYSLQAALRLRGEETAQRAEPLLATTVGRTGFALSHYTVALAGSAVLMVCAGVAGGITHGLRTTGVGEQLPRVLGAALVQVPAIWVIAGLALALYGLAPRLVALSWAVLVAVLLIAELGPLLQLSQWVLDVSPFAHVPRLPGGQFAAAPLLWLLAVAAGLSVLGLVGFRRRDVG